MKKIYFALFALLLFAGVQTSSAQQEESRMKILMTINYAGKKVVTELTSLSTSISRYIDEPIKAPLTGPKDSLSTKAAMPSSLYNSGQLYLSIDSRHITNELLQAFAKKNVLFDGSVTIVDSYNKVPTRTVTFGQASLVSYSDQVSSGYYGDSFGAASISISCKSMSINNIVIEQ